MLESKLRADFEPKGGLGNLLSSFDEFYIHQTSRPIATPATSDRNAYDRSFSNGYTADGYLYFGISSARYPNLGIQDCALTIAVENDQHSFHGSRRAPDDPIDMSTGPFRIEIQEAMKTLRVVLDENETALARTLYGSQEQHILPKTIRYSPLNK